MVVTVGIIGFVAMVTLPLLKSVLPNQEMMMFKKAYYITERVVSELVNDEILYPDSDDPNQNPYFGNTEEVEYKGEQYSGDTKFCELFASKINKSSEVDCSAHSFTDAVNPEGTVTTTDGVVWILPISTFAEETEPQDIIMDVNGNKQPNCFYNRETCKKPDRFTVKVYQDGRVSVEGIMEKEYLYRSNITKDAENETEDARNEDNANEENTEGE